MEKDKEETEKDDWLKSFGKDVENLNLVNQKIKAVKLKNDKTGKEIGDYVEVNQRVKAFRILYPKGTISTEIETLENGICVIQAKVYDDDYNLLSTGYAYEKENSTFINKTSYIENCETSAVGRALGFLGLGIESSIASKEEIVNAVTNQEEVKATENQLTFIKNLFSDKEDIKELKAILASLNKKKIDELSIEEASKIISDRKSKLEETRTVVDESQV